MRRHAPAATALLAVVAGSLEKAHILSGATGGFFPNLSRDLLSAAHHITVVTGDLSEIVLIVMLLPLASRLLKRTAELLEAVHGSVLAIVGSIARAIVKTRIAVLQVLLSGSQWLAAKLENRIAKLSHRKRVQNGARAKIAAHRKSASPQA